MTTGTENSRPGTSTGLSPRSILRRALAVPAAAIALAIAIGGGQAAFAPASAAAQASCPAQPTGLAPDGPGPTRFTVLIRINQMENVNSYTNFDAATGGLGGYVRPQDVFVINTRFKTTNPTVAFQLASALSATFPCNRIIGLNGLGLDPSLPGYAYSLAGHPAVWALMSDYEPMDWNGTAGTDPGRRPWNQAFKVAFKRSKAWNRRLSGTLAASALSAGQRSGLVPIFDSSWNYGQIAQDVDKKNRRLGGTHFGPQSVQTQDACADSGPAGYSSRLKGVFDQYRFKIVKKFKKVRKNGKVKKRKIKKRIKLKKRARPLFTNLATQISFSDTPNPSAGMAITKTSAATAAACARAGLKRGGGAFFFFASDDSMRLLFQQPTIAALRPLATGTASGGKPSGGVKPK
ncbi:hypothetical protein BH20ACT15_BH20ACT15_05580 [soil metagenome]